MNAREYQQKAILTVPTSMQFWKPSFVEDRYLPDTARIRLLINCALGMSGEAMEISLATQPEDIQDECGDGFWYSYVMLWALGVEHPFDPFPQVETMTASSPHEEMTLHAGQVCELVKKVAFHGKPLDSVGAVLIASTQQYINMVDLINPFSAPETFVQNFNKLKARYPDGFFQRG